MYQLLHKDVLLVESDELITYSNDMLAWKVGNVFYTDPSRELHVISADSPPLTLQEKIVQAVQQRLDDFARTRNYDGILSLCTYAASTVPKFQAEGQYGVNARDTTWSKLYEILAEVEAGTRPAPSGYADIESELPTLQWPADEALAEEELP